MQERNYRVVKEGAIAGKGRKVDDNITLAPDVAEQWIKSGHIILIEDQDRNREGGRTLHAGGDTDVNRMQGGQGTEEVGGAQRPR